MQKYKSKGRKEINGTGLGCEELYEYKQLLEDFVERYEESERGTEESSSDKKVLDQENKKKAVDMWQNSGFAWTGSDSWFKAKFWIFTTEFFIMSFYTTG